MPKALTEREAQPKHFYTGDSKHWPKQPEGFV
jgi:hypothetical protein